MSLHRFSITFWKNDLFVPQNLKKGKAYPTLVARITDPDLIFDTGEEGWETTVLVTTLNAWEKDGRFIVRRVLRDEKDRAQLSFLEGETFTYSFLSMFFWLGRPSERQEVW